MNDSALRELYLANKSTLDAMTPAEAVAWFNQRLPERVAKPAATFEDVGFRGDVTVGDIDALRSPASARYVRER